MMSSKSSTRSPIHPIVGPVLVTAALIRDQRGSRRFLIAKRKFDSSNEAGKWEFPGGKVEAGESPEASLAREILEELDCQIEVGGLFGVASHVYSSNERSLHVVLLCYDCVHLSGEPRALDAAEVRWIDGEELESFEWAKADVPLVEKLKASLG